MFLERKLPPVDFQTSIKTKFLFTFFKPCKKTIKPFIDYNATISPNRQDLPDAYFLDHSFWCIRTENLLNDHNFSPWNSLGNKILPIVTKDMFDVHNEGDIKKSIIWLNENKDKTRYLK